MNTYRQIYEQYHGSIPKDEAGRTYDIHHIDGNHSNNDITNLKAVSLQEHFDIHYAQQDWLACQLISLRLGLSPEERYELSRKAQQKRVANGDHHFTSSKWQSDNQLNRVANGTHPFVGGEIQRETNRQLVAEGKHAFQGEDGVSCRRVREGTHHFLGERNPMHAKVADGSHPWLGNGEVVRARQKQRVADGTHHFLGGEITCPHCNKSGGSTNMKRYHFDNCKTISQKTNKQPIITCPHCHKQGGSGVMKRWHFDNCKENQR